MAQTPIGFERWEPGQPWGDVVYDDGKRLSVHDPDGSIERDAQAYGARYNSQPKQAPATVPEPSLSGAASPPLPPSTRAPPVPAPPPMPSTEPLAQKEKQALEQAERKGVQSAQPELQSIQQGFGASPAAKALADHGIAVPQSPAAPAAAPQAQPGGGLSPALEAVQAHAPQLLAQKGEVKYEGPDQQTADAIRASSDTALTARGRAITEGTQAKGMGIQADAGLANDAYFKGWQQQMEVQGQQAAAAHAQQEAAAKLAKVKQTPIADHPDFPDWFVASSILGSIAGGFNEGFTGGRYKSTTLPMIQQLIGDWRENQKYNKSQLVESLTEQLGDRNAALMAAGAKLKEGIATMAEAKAKFARTPGAMKELTATADSLRAQALDEWGKTQAVVMGKTSESLSLQRGAGGTAANPTVARIRALGLTPEQYTKGLDAKVAEGVTVAQAATATKQIDADIALLESLKAANGGTLPTKGVIRIPQMLVPALSKLGYRPGMAAEETNGLINTYLTQKAKSYGGTVTQGDRDSAALEYGTSGDGFMRGLQRLRDGNNNNIRTALSQQFPGAGQGILDILLDDSASYGGVPNPPTAPLEKQNGPAAAPAPEAPVPEADQQQQREIEQRKEARKELLAQPEIAKQQQERERLPAAARFSPF
jgi:hypothetical protein